MKLLHESEFILLAHKKHNNLFNYSLVKYPVKLTQKILVIDPEYGEFTVAVNKHLAGQTNPQRANKNKGSYRKITTDIFIEKASIKHNNYYNYSKVQYQNMYTKVCIIDPIFGEFWQSPMGHLQGQGHPESGKIKSAAQRRTSLSEFIQQAEQIHGKLYDYSKVKYTNCDQKVCIIDPEFGAFWQSPYQHLRSHGCPKRTKQKKFVIHEDHIIPLSILRSPKKKFSMWFKDRPLYKFLDSSINLQKVSAKQNLDKNDTIMINGKEVSAHSVRNNYEIIALLIRKLLDVDPTDIIDADRQFIKNYFGL